MSKKSNPFDDVTDTNLSSNGETQERPPEPRSKSRVEEDASGPDPREETPDAGTEEEPAVESPPVEKSGPGFPSDDTTQLFFYPRQETGDEMDDLQHEVEGHLRRAYSVRNSEVREIHEAAVRTLLEQASPEQIAALVIERRGYSP
jgi:hypothetical protein